MSEMHLLSRASLRGKGGCPTPTHPFLEEGAGGRGWEHASSQAICLAEGLMLIPNVWGNHKGPFHSLERPYLPRLQRSRSELSPIYMQGSGVSQRQTWGGLCSPAQSEFKKNWELSTGCLVAMICQSQFAFFATCLSEERTCAFTSCQDCYVMMQPPPGASISIRLSPFVR